MSNVTTGVNDQDLIAKVVQHYIDGARSGKGDDMRPAFHEDATVFGYVGPDLFAGPIQNLFAWNDERQRSGDGARGPNRQHRCHWNRRDGAT